MTDGDVLHLGEVNGDGGTAGAVSSPPAPSWHRWVVIVAVMLVGAMVGSYAWLARTDALEESRIELVITEITHDSPRSNGALGGVTAYIHNAGSNDVTITDVRVPGWSEVDGPADVVTVPAGGTEVVAVGGELHCGSGMPDTMDAAVSTAAGAQPWPLPVPKINQRYSSVFGFRSGSVLVEPLDPNLGIDGRIEVRESTLIMVLPVLFRIWRVDAVEVVDVAASQMLGLDAQVSGSVGRQASGTGHDVRLEWTITDCAAAYLLGPTEITFEFADQDAGTVRLPDWAMNNLAFFVAQECSS